MLLHCEGAVNDYLPMSSPAAAASLECRRAGIRWCLASIWQGSSGFVIKVCVCVRMCVYIDLCVCIINYTLWASCSWFCLDKHWQYARMRDTHPIVFPISIDAHTKWMLRATSGSVWRRRGQRIDARHCLISECVCI